MSEELERVATEDAPMVRRQGDVPDWTWKRPAGEPTVRPTTPEELAHDRELTGFRHTPTSRELGLPDWPVNPNKEGVDYDDCPNPDCGNRDVPLAFKSGGRTIRRGEEYRSWATFQCSCCGTAWDRNTEQEVRRRAARGLGTARPTRSADVGRVISVPSRLYMDRYHLIDWSK